jgi:hypothetical protein
MAALNPPFVITVSSHGPENFRRALRVLRDQPGVRLTGDLAVTQLITPSMNVNVAAGECIIDGTETPLTQGSYHCENDAVVQLAVSAADATNPRWDLVVAKVQDSQYSGVTQAWSLAVVTGTPAPSPADPAMPANAIKLARLVVAANAASIVTANITDLRAYTTGSPYRARFYCNVAQSIPTGVGSYTVVSPVVVAYDPNNNVTISTGTYTAPVAGKYAVSGAVTLLTGTAGSLGAYILVGGPAASFGATLPLVGSLGGQVTSTVSDQLNLTAGQTVTLGVLHTNGSALNTQPGTAQTYMAIHLVDGAGN